MPSGAHTPKAVLNPLDGSTLPERVRNPVETFRGVPGERRRRVGLEDPRDLLPGDGHRILPALPHPGLEGIPVPEHREERLANVLEGVALGEVHAADSGP